MYVVDTHGKSFLEETVRNHCSAKTINGGSGAWPKGGAAFPLSGVDGGVIVTTLARWATGGGPVGGATRGSFTGIGAGAIKWLAN